MDTNVWSEPGGRVLKETLQQEARARHLMHQPPTRLADWQRGRVELRRRLLEAAGSFPPAPALEVREHGVIRMDGYRIVKLTYQSRPGLRVTGNLFVPDGVGPFPAVLNVHGHYAQGKIAANVAARGHALAREGFVVLSVDAIGAGERATVHGRFEHHGAAGAPLLSAGETLLGAQVYDNMRAIDLLQSLDYVDGARIGVTGASGGGNQTMWISALDPRVKASVPVVSVGTFEAYVTRGNCWCETLAGGLLIAEEWGVLGLIAPNPLLILTADREQIEAFLPAEMLRAYADARRVYGLYGAEERIAYQIIDRPHGYFPEMVRHMLGWFKHWLQGQGAALQRTIPAHRELPERELMCFAERKRPAEVKSLIEYVSLRTREVKKESMKAAKPDANRKRRELATVMRLPGGPELLRVSDGVAGEAEGRRFVKFTVEAEPGVLLPCMVILPEGRPSSVVIAVHPEGKEAALRQPAAQKVLRDGKALCLADLRTQGETRWAHIDDQADLFTARSALWLGRTMAGDWVKDLIAVRAAAAKVSSTRSVELLAFGGTVHPNAKDPAALARGAVFAKGDATLPALAAAVIDRRFAAVTVEGLLSTYVVDDAVPAYRYSVLVPGMLKWGDVSMLAALARCPVRVGTLLNSAGRRLSRGEADGWLAEVRRLCVRMRKPLTVQMMKG